MTQYSLNQIVPHHLTDSIRLGTQADGGYVINQRIVGNTDYVLSFGIADNWSFEEDFLKRNKTAKILGLDFSISSKIHFKKTFISFLRTLSLQRSSFTRFAKNLHTWKSFRSFWNNSNALFIQKGVSDSVHTRSIQSRGRFLTFDEIMLLIGERFGTIRENSIFVKMDIELSEYRVIPDLLKYARYLNGLVVEFHDLDITWSCFEELISELKNHFYITHIHGCNGNAVIPGTTIPSLIELTFVKKDLVSERELGNVVNYPLQGLDFPHTTKTEEVAFCFNFSHVCSSVIFFILNTCSNAGQEDSLLFGLMDTISSCCEI